MYFFADKFVSDVLMGFIKGFDDEMYWIHFIFKIFLYFQIIRYDLVSCNSQNFAFCHPFLLKLAIGPIYSHPA